MYAEVGGLGVLCQHLFNVLLPFRDAKAKTNLTVNVLCLAYQKSRALRNGGQRFIFRTRHKNLS